MIEKPYAHPNAGGSYIHDPKTGELRQNVPDAAPDQEIILPVVQAKPTAKEALK